MPHRRDNVRNVDARNVNVAYLVQDLEISDTNFWNANSDVSSENDQPEQSKGFWFLLIEMMDQWQLDFEILL